MKNIITLIKMEGGIVSKSILTCGILTVFCSGVIDATAAGFLLESEINARATYDDNVLGNNNDESASILMIEPKARLTYKDNDWDTTINASIAGTSYSSELQNHVDSYFDLGTAYQSQRDIYSVTASYDNYSYRTEDTDALGLTLEQVENTKLMLAPQYTRNLTERVSLSIAYSYSDVDVDPTTDVYLPYETQTATAALEYKLSQKSKLSLVINAIDYTSENNISEYEVLASQVVLAHNFSEMVSATISVGFDTIDFTTRSSESFEFAGSTVTGTQAVESDSSGGSYEATFDAKWVELQASRSTDSNSFGGLDEKNKLRAKFRMQVTPLIGIVLLIDRTDIEELNPNVVAQSRVYTKIAPAMNFTLAHNLKLRAEYARIEQDYAINEPDKTDLDKNTFYLNLKYDFPSI